MIGRIDNKSTGDCSCYVWDHLDGRCYKHQMNILNPHTWREHGPRIGLMNLDVIGLHDFALGIERLKGAYYVHGTSQWTNDIDLQHLLEREP